MITYDGIYIGDGKTHYIKEQLSLCSVHKNIALNEAFTPRNAIFKLRSLPLYLENVGLFFNFTLLPPGVSGRGWLLWHSKIFLRLNVCVGECECECLYEFYISIIETSSFKHNFLFKYLPKNATVY